MTAAERVAEAMIITKPVEGYCIRAKVVIVPRCMPAVLLLPDSYRVTLETSLRFTAVHYLTWDWKWSSKMPDPKQITNLIIGCHVGGNRFAFIIPESWADRHIAHGLLTERDPLARNSKTEGRKEKKD